MTWNAPFPSKACTYDHSYGLPEAANGITYPIPTRGKII